MINTKTFPLFFGGLIQGICLIAMPAASTIITNPHVYGFSSSSYGSLFIPQCLLSITASLFNPYLSSKFGFERVFKWGLLANLISMFLLASSALATHHFLAAYSMLFIAAGCMGLGFGLLVPTLNGVLALMEPLKVNSMLLVLNGLLGVGTALAPLLTIFFSWLGFWWGLPALLVFLCVLALMTNLAFPSDKTGPAAKKSIPLKFWIFASFALLYGIIETLNGTWLSIFMDSDLKASINMQMLALAAFWVMITFGRIFFSMPFFKAEIIFLCAPLSALVAFLIIASLQSGAGASVILAFGFMGLSLAVLFPLIISFGSKKLPQIAHSVPGWIIASYQVGYGMAAFGVGPLHELMSLRSIYLMGAFISFILGILAFIIVRNNKHA